MHTHANHSSLQRTLFQTVLPFDTFNSSLRWLSPSRPWEGEILFLPHTVNLRNKEDEGNLYLQQKQREFQTILHRLKSNAYRTLLLS